MAGIIGFLSAVAFIPELSGGASLGRYAVIACLIPLAMIGKTIPIHFGHLLGLIALLGAGMTIGSSAFDAFSFWKLAALALVFVYGSTLQDLKPIAMGMILGIAVSGILTWFQKFGLSPVDQVISPAGLFMNKNLLAEAGVVTTILAIAYRQWALTALTLSAALLPMSRGAILGLIAAGIAWVWSRNKTAGIILALGIITLAVGAFAFGYRLETVDHRMAIWADAAQNLKWFGNGWGSFYVQFPSTAEFTNVLFQRPEHAHNDFLELIYDLGLISVPFFLLFGYILIQAEELERLILLSILVMGAFGFPLYAPFTGFAFALVAGHVARRGASLPDLLVFGRSLLHQGLQALPKRRGGHA